MTEIKIFNMFYMKNLNHYTGNCLDFHKTIVDNKYVTQGNPDYKVNIQNLENKISERFGIYDKLFTNNTLELIDSSPFTDQEKMDLLQLYSYKSKIIQRLKRDITTTETHRIINTCPNCTISEINSFDHYIPKEEFPEFVVNPKNLFPSCTVCNGHKSKIWRKDNQKIFLNLYLDWLPNFQYLFVNLSFEKDLVIADFYLDNFDNMIEVQLFEIIKNHYNNLHLLGRFNNGINEIVTSLEHTIRSFGKNLTTEELSNLIVEKSNQDRVVFGHNFWKSILEIELAQNIDYLNRILKR